MSKVDEYGSLTNQYSNFIALSKYARWLDDKSRRETWSETVDRYVNYMTKQFGQLGDVADEVRSSILNLEVMPSMRALMTSGPAADDSNVAMYNCSFVPIDNLRALDEIMYILMCGTGVGFSVEREFTLKIPVVAEEFFETDTTIIVNDSKMGWAKGYKELNALLIQGQIPKWDLSRVRPAGARLKTMGGRASGGAPLDDLFNFTVKTFKNAAGRKLKPIELHDIVCYIASIVVMGSVRRSALISFSDLDDYEMSMAKSGTWWEKEGQRALANNSAVYRTKPTYGEFLKEWRNLYESKSGERGIHNADGIKKHIKSFGRREAIDGIRANPCHEIYLRPNQFCNLSSVQIRENDSLDDIRGKVRIAAIIGTYQSAMTNFKYLRKVWKDNSEEERLLGISLSGIYGHEFMSGRAKQEISLPDFLTELREIAIDVNAQWARKLGINPSTAVSAIKPEGTTAQLTGVSSGIHPWFAPYYIRTIRGDNKDPMTKLLKDQGVPNEPDIMNPDDTTVFSFPIKAPVNAVTNKDITAVEHMELWRTYYKYWTEHSPSVTITVQESEWADVGAWVYNNFDDIGGLSFLPADDHIYKQAPYQEITEDEYNAFVEQMPQNIAWHELSLYELYDNTSGSQELACGGTTSCELVDISK